MVCKKNKKSGQSLVSVIVAAGIGAIVLGFLTDTIVKQGISQKFLTQKLEINDLGNNLITTFSKSNSCTCQFANSAVTNPNFANYAGLKFDSTQAPGTQKISIKKLYSGCAGGANAPIVLAEDGEKILNSTNLVVDKVELAELRPTGGPNEWQGKWQISFQVGPGALIRSVKPLSITQKITINPLPDPTVAVISACNGVSAGTGTVDHLAKWSLTQGLLEDSAVVEISGNVGIGTSTPLSPLHVAGTTTTTNLWTAWPDLAVQNKNPTVNNLSKIGFIDSSGFQVASIAAVLDHGTPQKGELQFGTVKNGTGNSAMRIDSNGNVGIGTTAPGIIAGANKYLTLFDSSPGFVSNELRGWAIGPSAKIAKIDFINRATDTNTYNVARIEAIVTPADTRKAYLKFYTKDTTLDERMVITETGNVGIGTTVPLSPLHVAGATTTTNLWAAWPDLAVQNRNSTVNNLSKLGFVDSSGFQVAAIAAVLDHGTPQNGQLQLGTVKNGIGNSAMRIDSDGNVGVGTTTPGAKLDVADTGTTASAIIVPRAGNFTGTTVNGMIRYNTASTLFEFRQNGAWVNYTTVSDGRLKTDVEPVVNGLDIVNQLNPVFYNWDRNNPKASSFADKHEVGFIAQEVEKVLPEVVNKGEDSYRSVEYGKIVSVVVAAVKELYAKVLGHDEKIQAQDREIASVKAEKADKTEVDQLKTENDKLKQENAAMKTRLDKIEKMLRG